MAAIMLLAKPCFHANISHKSLFTSANIYEEDIVCEDYCIPHHDDKTCFLPACKFHVILLGEIEELLQKLDTFCFTYQHVDSLYTLFRYGFNGKYYAKCANVIDNVQKAISINQENKRVAKMPSIATKRPLRKMCKEHFMIALQKNKSTQSSGSLLAERIEKAKKTKLELEVLKIVDSFLDGHSDI